MSESHPARTPFPVGFQARPATDQEYDTAKHLDYPQLAGSILYAATISRPDLLFPAGILTRYISKWWRDHYNAAKHLLRYIRGTIDVALTFDGRSEEPTVTGYADAELGWVSGDTSVDDWIRVPNFRGSDVLAKSTTTNSRAINNRG
jgi:hypothetical protein